MKSTVAPNVRELANSRIESLLPSMKIIARHVRGSSPELEIDELIAEMTIAIIKKAFDNPKFLNQKDGYLLTFAGWTARHYATKTRRICSRFHEVSHDDPDFQEGDHGSALLVLDNVEHIDQPDAMRDALNDLGPTYLQIVAMLIDGFKKSEIANALKIHPMSLHDRIQTLKGRLNFDMESA